MENEEQQRMDAQARQQQQQAGLQANQRKVEERTFNPSFFDRIQDPDVETDIFDWLEREFPALFAGSQIVGQRTEDFERQQEWLNRAKGMRYAVENSPGELLQRHPGVLATMEGADSKTAVTQPITTGEKRALSNAMEVATTRQSLSVGARGLKSVTTATSETRTVRHDEDDDGGMVASATGGLFG